MCKAEGRLAGIHVVSGSVAPFKVGMPPPKTSLELVPWNLCTRKDTLLEQQAHQATKTQWVNDKIENEELHEKCQFMKATLQSRQAEIAQKDEEIAGLQKSFHDKDREVAEKTAQLAAYGDNYASLQELLDTEKTKAKAIQDLFDQECDRNEQMQVVPAWKMSQQKRDDVPAGTHLLRGKGYEVSSCDSGRVGKGAKRVREEK